MKKQTLQATIKKGEGEMIKLVSSLKMDLQKLKLNHTRGEVKNPREAKTIRRSIAQLLTNVTLAKFVKEQS